MFAARSKLRVYIVRSGLPVRMLQIKLRYHLSFFRIAVFADTLLHWRQTNWKEFTWQKTSSDAEVILLKSFKQN